MNIRDCFQGIGEEKKREKTREKEQNIYMEFSIDHSSQCYFACPLLVACLHFQLHAFQLHMTVPIIQRHDPIIHKVQVVHDSYLCLDRPMQNISTRIAQYEPLSRASRSMHATARTTIQNVHVHMRARVRRKHPCSRACTRCHEGFASRYKNKLKYCI